MFAKWCGDVLAQRVIFVQRFVPGTGRGFETSPLHKHKRSENFKFQHKKFSLSFPKTSYLC